MFRYFTRIYHLFFSALAFYTVIFDLIHSSNIVNYFSYFTILANILAASAFLIFGLKYPNRKPLLDSFRGAAVLYMLITGIVYAVLLQGTQGQLTYPWVNFIFHKLMPVIIVIDWLIYPPKSHLKFSNSFLWFIFPVLYSIYTILRGSIVHWYPYAFLDPTKNGYLSVYQHYLIILFTAWITSLSIIFIGNKRSF